jgi:hypothetical protein
MEKLDLTKHYKNYYTAKNKPEILTIERVQYLSITGKGDPSGQLFAEKIQALYTTAYAIKFAYKAQGKDFVVAKLEGLWSFDEEKYKSVSMEDAPESIPRSEWDYRLLIRLPDYVTENEITKSKETVSSKKQIAFADEVVLFNMEEGKVVQMLHVGPFDTEIETLKNMQECITANGFEKNGCHHEIYLSDFRKTAPEKLKTILREPVK